MRKIAVRHHPLSLSVCVLIALLLAGCNIPGARPQSTEPPPYIPPESPTATPDPSALVLLDEEQSIAAGAYAFRPVTGFDAGGQQLILAVDGGMASLSSPDESLYFSLDGVAAGLNEDAQSCLQMVLTRMAQDVEAFSLAPSVSISAGGLEGFSADFSGSLLSVPVYGRVAALHPDGRCFSMLGIAAGSQSQARWEQSGQYIFQKLQANLRFLGDIAISPCQIAVSPDYGFSPQNPIQVGNATLYDGRSREEAYLNTLRGPAGQEIYYSRKDPIYSQGDEIVDVYAISYDGQEQAQLLYFDIYSYATPMAPLGYSCEAPFPISAP